MRLMTCGDLIVEIMKQEGVNIIFGYPGGMALPLYDSLYESGIEHILTRHEQGAIHAADGYARSTGKVGVCIATSGPGATNLITGIATANMDSVPLVCLTCQVTRFALGKDSFQEADISGITTPITKHNFLIKTPELLPGIIKKAFHIARTGRPGPVVVDIPKDVLTAEIDADVLADFPTPGYHPPHDCNPAVIDAVVEALQTAQKPLLMIGGGLVNADMAGVFAEIVLKTGVPFVSTLMGLSAVDEKIQQYYLGMPGMHGTYTANMAISECDFLLSLGSRFDDRVICRADEFAPQARIAHFDVDPSEIGKLVDVTWRVLADLRWSAPALAERVQKLAIEPWWDYLRQMQQEHPLRYDTQSAVIKPQQVYEEVNKVMADNAIVVTDVGQHQMWAAHYAAIKRPRGFLTSGGLGTMGYGLPAAVGAAIGNPDSEVWLYVGDGGIMMNCQEIATAVEHNLNIKILVINNHGLGMVRQWQRLFFGNRYSGSQHHAGTDFTALAKAMGAQGLQIAQKDKLAEGLAYAQTCSGPVLIDVLVEDEENVYPMVSPGAAPTDMLES